MAIIWGCALDGLWYSKDGTNWTDAGRPSGISTSLAGVWGPTSAQKVYVAVGNNGIYRCDGTNWELEDSFADTYVDNNWGDQWFLSTWCSPNDNLAICSGQGSTYNLIRARDGSPGTSWATEYTGGAGVNVVHVHGSADGYAYAIAHETGAGRRSFLLKRDSGGTWSQATTLGNISTDVVSWYRVRVVAEDDVRIIGESDIGGTNYSRIWKWNGISLSEEYSVLASSKTFNDIWMEDADNGWMLDDEGGASPNDTVVDTGGGWAKKNDITGTGETQSKYTICASDYKDEAWVFGYDFITHWDGSTWTGQFMTGTPIFYQSFYQRGATLWASGGTTQLWYSTQGGALGSWVQVEQDPSWPGGVSADNVGIAGPTSEFKVYTCVTELGIASWDGNSWTTEYDTGGVGPYHAWLPPNTLSVWCNEDDTLVIGGAFGTLNQQIVAREGAPGSTWYIEFDTADYVINSVHGTPDGTHVFAIAENSGDMVLLERTSGAPGSWAEVARDSSGNSTWVRVRVISDTEVWIAGEGFTTGTVGHIWKYNGTSLSVEFTGTSDWFGLTGVDSTGLWMNPDGSEGWACFHGNDVGNEYEKIIRYNGSTWTLNQARETATRIHDITQLPGNINSAFAIYATGGPYDIYNYYGDNQWPTGYNHGYPPIENYRAVWYPTSTIATNALYIENSPTEVDVYPPSLDPSTLDPGSGDVDVDPTTNVTLDILDTGAGLDTSTVIITVAGSTAWTGGSQQPGFAVTESEVTDGYRYVINPDSDFSYDQVVNVAIDAYDFDSNRLETDYSFTIMSAPPVIITRLWAGGLSELWYSDDGGDNWTEVTSLPGWIEGIWGPENTEKIYTVTDGVGIHNWDGTSWNVELSDTSASGHFNWTSQYMTAVWCDETDTLVCATGLGTSYGANDRIWTRPGGPGTGWVNEYTSASGVIRDVHGNSTGAYVFALESDGSNYYVRQRNAFGVWNTVHSFAGAGKAIYRIRADASGNWRLFGEEGGSIKVWTYSFFILMEEYSVAASTANFAGAWMSDNGQDGGIAWDTTGNGAFYRKTTGVWAVDDSDIATSRIMTGCAGIQGVADDRILFARGRFMRRSGGAWIDYSWEPIGSWADTNPVSYLMQWQEFEQAAPVGDTDPPTLQNQDPGPGTTDQDRDTNITLEIVDTGSGVDDSTVVITVEGATAWTGDAQQSGFTVTKSTVTDGFRYVINPDAIFDYEQVVDVGVDADDLATSPNSLSTSYSFTAETDIVAPYLQNQDPIPSTTGHSIDTNITVEVVDDETGVDASTVVITVEGSTAWTGDAQQTGFVVTKTAITGGFRYVINPDDDFWYEQVVDVGVDADDLAGSPNSLSTSYSFTTVTMISLQNQDPAPDETSVPLETDIEFDIIDGYSTIYGDSIIVGVNGTTVYQNETEQSALFSVTRWALTDGYRFLIEPACDFLGGDVEVTVYADNVYGYTLDTSYSFGLNSQYIFEDYFGDGLQGGMEYTPRNGNISESGGNVNLSISGGTNGDYWTSVNNAPFAHVVANLAQEDTEELVYTAELVAWSYVDANAVGGFNLFYGDNPSQYAYYFEYAPSSGYLGLRYFENYSTATFGTSTTIGDPSVTPVRLRIRHNFSLNLLIFEYSVDECTWTQMGTRTPTFTPDRIGFYVKNWSSIQATSASWSFLTIGEVKTEYSNQTFIGAGFTDSVEFPTNVGVGGSRHTFPQNNPLYEENKDAQPGVGFVEDVEFPDGVGTTVRHTFPEVSPGLPQDPSSTGMRDSILVQQGSAIIQAESQTSDSEAHPHFIGRQAYVSFYYDATEDPWHDPTNTNHTGYARDGYKYTGGVLDAGPVLAPWAGEAAGTDRSSRRDFPIKAMIVGTLSEVTIFDMDGYESSGDMDVWMRFRYGSGSNYYLIGALDNRYITQLTFKDGVLASVRQEGSARGGLSLIDFRAEGQDFFVLVRSDDDWIGVSGRDITDRNITGNLTTTGGTGVRLASESLQGLAVEFVPRTTPGDYDEWYITCGEDNTSIVHRSNVSGVKTTTSGLLEAQGDTSGSERRVLIDKAGILWFSIDNVLHRNIYDYRDFVLRAEESNVAGQPATRVNLPFTITCLADGPNYIFAGTTQGIYIVQKSDMSAHLAYTVAGGGGGGKNNVPPRGELLVGENPEILSMRSFASDSILGEMGFVIVATTYTAAYGGGISVVRLFDDILFLGQEFPDIAEDGAYFPEFILLL